MKIETIDINKIEPKSNDLKVRKIKVSPGQYTKIHNHHDKECWVVLSGQGQVISQNKVTPIIAGQQLIFEPFEEHSVINNGEYDLVFNSYWYDDWNLVSDFANNFKPEFDHVMLETAFPTPNGPLHIGHLSGAYLLSSVIQRCCHLLGQKSFSYCGTYGHTNHINVSASKQNITYEDLVSKSESIIQNDLSLFGCHYDHFLTHYPKSGDFDVICSEFINKILSSKFIEEREVLHPYSNLQKKFISESYVLGKCPNCLSPTIGIECENCGLYQDECNLIEPVHSVTNEILVKKKLKKLYLKIDSDILYTITTKLYSDKTAASRIGYERLNSFVDAELLQSIPITVVRENGISIYDGQKLSIVMERILRSYYGLSLYPSAKKHMFFCGLDNFCGSGIFLPYTLRVINVPFEQLSITVVNNFCLLEDRKFSTSLNHAIWANDFLTTYPSDMLRGYLANIQRITKVSVFKLNDFLSFSEDFLKKLISLFGKGKELSLYHSFDKVESGEWLNQDINYYGELNKTMHFCINSFTSYSLNCGFRRIEYLIDIMQDYFDESQDYVNNKNYFRTRLSLIIYSYKALAYCLYPIMHNLATLLMQCIDCDINNFKKGINNIEVVSNYDISLIIEELQLILIRVKNS